MSPAKLPLYLHEEIMLLALRDEAGTVEFGSQYAYALGGALLAELLLRGRIAAEDDKKRLVNLLADDAIGEPILDECLQKVATARRRARIQTWLLRFAGIKQLHHRIAQGLCDRGILYADEQTILLVFHRKVYPELNPEPERKLIERLRDAIFTDSDRVEPRTVILVSLANSAGLLRTTFDKKELKKRKQRIDQLTNGELTGKAAKEAIEAAQTAAMIACIMPAIVTTTVATH